MPGYAQSKPEASSVFTGLFTVDGKDYAIILSNLSVSLLVMWLDLAGKLTACHFFA